jgi:2-dehydro-3-deoxygluconokinase
MAQEQSGAQSGARSGERTGERTRVVSVGEVMIELARGGDGRFGIGCGGDTFNTAVYLARAGAEVAYATALGDDPYSEGILALAAAENVARDLVLRAPGRKPGLYVVDSDSNGQRRLYDWHDAAPARDLFEFGDWSRIAEGLLGARMIYFTGITLSLYSNIGLGRFLAVVELARKAGARIAFDGNFRPHGWKGDLGRARTVFIEALKRVDVALPAFDDEAILWGDPSPESTVERMQAFGIAEVVVKNGPSSALIAAGGHREHVPVPEVVEPIDAMAAGDGFNAGYLAARLKGAGPADAVMAAHQLAAQVIRHRGAIMPRVGGAVH